MFKKILIIDDDIDILYVYQEIFVNTEYKCYIAKTPREGLLKTGNDIFDLIITDFKMPAKDGYTLIKEIRSGGLNAKTPCLVVSAFLQEFLSKPISDLAKVYTLQKPFDKESLIKKNNEIFFVNMEAPKPAMKIDVKIINPILTSTISTIKSMTQLEITANKPFVKEAKGPSGDISGIVGITSSTYKGTIAISFKKELYLKIVSLMLMAEYTEINDECKDAVAEILNIIFGQTKKILSEQGHQFEKAIPSIIDGANHTVSHPSNMPVIVIPFVTQHGEFRIEVCAANAD